MVSTTPKFNLLSTGYVENNFDRLVETAVKLTNEILIK